MLQIFVLYHNAYVHGNGEYVKRILSWVIGHIISYKQVKFYFFIDYITL